MQQNYVKSPLNYIGGKYRIIHQIQQYFPDTVNNFVDLFCGGCDVTINTVATKRYANDINYLVVDIFREFQKYSIDDLLSYIDTTIKTWGLTDRDTDAYRKFRDYYNKTKQPLDLFVLICFSFNNQIRFNSKHEFNMTFGLGRSYFTDDMRLNLVKFLGRIKDVEFSTKPFQDFDFSVLKQNDFLYADPPYLISCATYNDGKRGFTGWGEPEERTLYSILSDLDKRGVKFALSNVSEHKGEINTILLDWCHTNGYHIHNIDMDYNSCNYQVKNTDKPTQEVLITNYPVGEIKPFSLW